MFKIALPIILAIAAVTTTQNYAATAQQNCNIGSLSYIIPGSTRTLNIDTHTLRQVAAIECGPKWILGFFSPCPTNRVILDDGSAWITEASVILAYGHCILKTGDAVVIRKAVEGGDFPYRIEGISYGTGINAKIWKKRCFTDKQSYVVSDLIQSDDENTTQILLKHLPSNQETVWNVTGGETASWQAGDLIIIGSDTAPFGKTPGHILINASCHQSDDGPADVKASSP